MSFGDGLEGLVGKSFNGYLVTRYIARGGMGAVYEATQLSLDRPVAIKFLFPYLSDDPTFRDRFQREARAIARLNHPNIVRVLDFGMFDSLHYMVMDLIDSESLRSRLVRLHKDGTTLQIPTTVNILKQVGSALTYAHELGFVHRDVKPGNVLLSKGSQAYLADFGVVKLIGDTQITTTGTLVGTPDYMAPEQSSGAAPIGPASDQYSLAIVAYEMLTARVPFQAATPVAVMHKHIVEPPTPPRQFHPWIPADTEATLLRALSKHPDDRFETVDAFVSQLAASLASTATPDSVTAVWPIELSRTTPPPQGTPAPGHTPPGMRSDVYPGTHLSQPSAVHPYVASPLQMTPPDGSQYPPQQPGSYPGYYSQPAGAGAPPLPPAPPPPTSASDGGRSNNSVIQGLGVLLVLILLVGGFILFLNRDGDSDTPLAIAVESTATSEPEPDPTETAEMPATEEPATAAADEPTASEAVDEPTPTAEPQPTAEATATEAVVVAPTSEAPEGYREVIIFAAHRGDVHDSQIYIMNPDGSDERQLTYARGHSWGPRVSPDGTQFFFSSVAPGEHQEHGATGGGFEGSGNHDVYLADVNGNNITKITTEVAWENGWSWSPDGEWIAFTTDRDGNWEIYLMTPDGKNFTRVTNSPAADGWPSWTPDGRIVFASDRSGTSEIYIMNADGSNVYPLTNRPDSFDTYPFVSPDGTKIVFSSQNLAANEGEIYVMDIDGSNVTRLTSTVALNYAPSWSPDGAQIVFASDRTGNHEIFTMNADGSNLKRITNDPGEDTTPVWAYIREP